MTQPAQAYQAGLDAATRTRTRLERRYQWLGPARLLTFVLLIAVAWAVGIQGRLAPVVVLLPAVGFMALVAWHARSRQEMARAGRAVEFHERGLGRLAHRWAGQGPTGAAWQEPDHPYAADLDLFGHGSLFQRISEARTLAGERILAAWLQHPAPPEVVVERQGAVRELAPRLAFRESLAVLGSEVRASFDERPLIRWAEAVGPGFPAVLPALCMAAATALVLAVAGALAGWWPAEVIALPLLVVIAIGADFRVRVGQTITGVSAAARELADLAALLERLEAEPVESPLARRLRDRLTAGGLPASQQIWRLRRLIALLDTRGNQLVMLVLPLLLWTTQVAVAIDRWRRLAGPAIAGWIEAAGEYEALASLAGLAFEHPEDCYPEFSPGAGFEAAGLGHLLLEAGGVRNDLHIGGGEHLLLVSGSNMSGKSTLLRSVGTAVVLAQMGAPVRASRLRLEPLQVGASIATHDSLLEGKSRFYAEITRLRQIIDLAGREPRLLFLLDELLSGTNSHDRLVGAEAVIRRLVERGAIGILTTHDLALTRVATELGPRARNVHFRDELEGQEIRFDYRMREGVVDRGNALALMRSIGLEV